MISFLRLGDFGQLGNQMFQFAAIYSLSKTNNLELKIPIETTYTRNYHGHKLDLFDSFNIPNSFLLEKNQILSNLDKLYKETGHSFNKNFFNIQNGTNIEGYFQTEKYFKNHINDIKNLFSFKDEIYTKCFQEISYIKDTYNLPIVSIHVRRGDYITNQNNHPLCSVDYYLTAINEYFSNQNYIFYIFSDDIEWCKETFVGEDNLIFSIDKTHFEDLCLMSLCDHNVIANSSFSWWGAWLNQNLDKKVIAPKKWFGVNLSYLDTDDIIPNNWIKI